MKMYQIIAPLRNTRECRITYTNDLKFALRLAKCLSIWTHDAFVDFAHADEDPFWAGDHLAQYQEGHKI